MHRPARARRHRRPLSRSTTRSLRTRPLKDWPSALNSRRRYRRRCVYRSRTRLRHHHTPYRSSRYRRRYRSRCGRSSSRRSSRSRSLSSRSRRSRDTGRGSRHWLGLHGNRGSNRRRRHWRARCRSRRSRGRRGRSRSSHHHRRLRNDSAGRRPGRNRRRGSYHHRTLPDRLRHDSSRRRSSGRRNRCTRCRSSRRRLCRRGRWLRSSRRLSSHRRSTRTRDNRRRSTSGRLRGNHGRRPRRGLAPGHGLLLLPLQDRLQRIARLRNMAQIEPRLRLGRLRRRRPTPPVVQIVAHPVGLSGLNRTRVRLRLSHANCRQSIQNRPALDFQFPREIIDSNFAHPSLFVFPSALAVHCQPLRSRN
jgi:hypothetical protein